MCKPAIYQLPAFFKCEPFSFVVQLVLYKDKYYDIMFVVLQSNVGHQLLVKQGWQAGQGLGKQNQGK